MYVCVRIGIHVTIFSFSLQPVRMKQKEDNKYFYPVRLLPAATLPSHQRKGPFAAYVWHFASHTHTHTPSHTNVLYGSRVGEKGVTLQATMSEQSEQKNRFSLKMFGMC